MPQPSIAKAALWMAGWLTLTLAMSIAGKAATREVDVFQVMLMRSALGVALLLPVMAAKGFEPLRTGRPGLLLARNVVHYGAQYSWFLALSLIPLAQVVAIEFTFPVWTALLAAAFLGERLGSRRLVAIALGFAGVLVIVRPGFSAVDFGQVVALAAAIGFGASVAMTKALTRSESVLTVIFYMMAIQLAIGLLPGLAVWQWPSASTWGWLAVIGIAGTFSHYCFTSAMLHADATVVTPMDFLRVPLSVAAGWIVFAEAADLTLALGAGLILAGNALNLNRAATTRAGFGRPRDEA